MTFFELQLLINLIHDFNPPSGALHGLNRLAELKDDMVTLPEFVLLCRHYSSLLHPLYVMRDILKKKIVFKRFWNELRARREKYYGRLTCVDILRWCDDEWRVQSLEMLVHTQQHELKQRYLYRYHVHQWHVHSLHSEAQVKNQQMFLQKRHKAEIDAGGLLTRHAKEEEATAAAAKAKKNNKPVDFLEELKRKRSEAHPPTGGDAIVLTEEEYEALRRSQEEEHAKFHQEVHQHPLVEVQYYLKHFSESKAWTEASSSHDGTAIGHAEAPDFESQWIEIIRCKPGDKMPELPFEIDPAYVEPDLPVAVYRKPKARPPRTSMYIQQLDAEVEKLQQPGRHLSTAGAVVVAGEEAEKKKHISDMSAYMTPTILGSRRGHREDDDEDIKKLVRKIQRRGESRRERLASLLQTRRTTFNRVSPMDDSRQSQVSRQSRGLSQYISTITPNSKRVSYFAQSSISEAEEGERREN